jgi:hypothetical protein
MLVSCNEWVVVVNQMRARESKLFPSLQPERHDLLTQVSSLREFCMSDLTRAAVQCVTGVIQQAGAQAEQFLELTRRFPSPVTRVIGQTWIVDSSGLTPPPPSVS